MTSKVNLILIGYLIAIVTVSILLGSCASGRKAQCDAYGSTSTIKESSNMQYLQQGLKWPCFNLIDMLKKRIKELEATKADVLQRLDSIHEADADPNVKAIYQSDLQYKLVCIEDAIHFEKMMMPFKYTLVAFVVAVIAMFIYFFI